MSEISSEKPIEQAPNQPQAPSVVDKMMGNAAGPKGGADLSWLKDVLEKNLKWSQIIYEQNRRINRKLAWAAVANWLRLLIIAVPIILGLLYLPPIIKEYRCFFKGGADCPKNASPTIESLLKLFQGDMGQRR